MSRNPASALSHIQDLLTEKFKERGGQAGQNLALWLSGDIPFAFPEILEKHLDPERLDLLFDAFWQILPFGTGGRRGKVGYGPNRMNPTALAMTVQGHCNYLKSAFPGRENLAVVVANDVRCFKDISGAYAFLGQGHPLLGMGSRNLGELACGIYAANGVTPYFACPSAPDAVLSTPELSFLIVKLNALGGINISASHNPPDDNGVKVYDAFGSQPLPPDDQVLVDVMKKAREIRSLPYAQALEKGLVRPVPEHLHAEYVENYVRMYGNTFRPVKDLPVTYTPLCGCGLTTVGEILERLGFPLLVPPGQGPDGSFEVIPFRAPNPEVFQSTEPARKFADSKGSGIVLSSDPDADRVGLEIKLEDKSWYHFDGNQIASMLGYFLMLDPKGPGKKGLVIETLVTTKILGEIVKQAGDSWIIDDLLVGFKYIADVLKKLERDGVYKDIRCSPDDLILAAEESHGVITDPGIRDKDSAPACMYLAALYQRLAREGKTLLDYYVGILEELGGFDCVGRSIMMAGAAGMQRKEEIMAFLRKSPPKTLAGQSVKKAVDYWDEQAFGPFVSDTDKMPRDVIQLFTDAFIVTIRPSGTEPKLKFYCQLMPKKDDMRATGMELVRQAREKTKETANKIYNELLNIIGFSLGEPALLLPDIVDLDRKLEFDAHTGPELLEKLDQGAFDSLPAALEWLRQKTASMTPGTDPLPALKEPVAALLVGRPEKDTGNAGPALSAWARQ